MVSNSGFLEELKEKSGWNKWEEFHPLTQTIVKLFPLLLILFAIPLTVGYLQTQQNINSQAAGTVNVPTSIDASGATDVSSALNTFIASVPDGSTVVFPVNAIYLLSQGLQFANRSNLEFQGNGTTLKITSSATGSNQLSSPFVLGHTYNGSWNDNNNNITIHDFTLIGNNPNPGVFTSGQEGESGMEIEGTHNLTVYNMTIKGVWSDGFKIGDNSTGVRIYNSHVIDAGRNGVSTISGSNIEMDHNAFDKIGYVIFDVEPNSPSEANTFQNFHHNTFGTWGAEFFALDGSHTGASIHDITVNNNVGSGRSLLTVVNNGGTTRNANIVFTNNKTSVSASGPVLNFAYIDGLTVTGNSQPLTSGLLMNITNSTVVNLTTSLTPTVTITNTTTPTKVPTPTLIPAPNFSISSGPTAGTITNTSAKITWYLSDNGTGQVQYGSTTNFGLTSTAETSFNWNYHIQTISGLTPGTMYHYRVKSVNQSGTTIYSADKTFTTTGGITQTPTPTPKPTATPTPTPALPSQPTNLSASPYCNQKASLVKYKWSLSTAAIYYLISWAGEPSVNVGNVSSYSVNPTCTTGPGGCSFTYNAGISWNLKACNSKGCSSLANGPYYTSYKCQ